MELTQEELKILFHYDLDTGTFTRLLRTSNKAQVGQIAGCHSSRGYRVIRVYGKLYPSHRLAWLYVHGEFPAEGLDHINGDKCDNRINNLRLASPSENLQNIRGPFAGNISGLLGASFHKQCNRWSAAIRTKGKRTYLGLFSTPEAAHQAYLNAKRELHPFGML